MQRQFDRLTKPGDKKILLIVLDGLGGLPKDGRTELEAAWTPNLDKLARESALGRLTPIEHGITPGSGPAHIALFGYDPLEFQVGRGVLECLGSGLTPGPGDLCARGNFATAAQGNVTDRRAKRGGQRMLTREGAELCAMLQQRVPRIEDVEVTVRGGEEHRFAVMFRGPGLAEGLEDSDPGKDGLPVQPVTGRPEAVKAVRVANEFLRLCAQALAGRDYANFVLLRGLGLPPVWPTMQDRFRLQPACVAVYPMYRGLARLVGMTILDAGRTWESSVDAVARHMAEFDFFFLHLKDTDKAGEDGDFDSKVELIERFDEEFVPRLSGLGFDVLCITGDHSTPAQMHSHSWHYVPVMLKSAHARVQVNIEAFGERACLLGTLGSLYSRQLMGLLLAHSGRLDKFGA